MNLISKNKKLIISFIVWLSSIFFFHLILLVKNNQTNWTEIEIGLFILTIILGFISFAIFILSLEKRFHKKYPSVKASIYSMLSFIGFLIFGLSLVMVPLFLYEKLNNKEIVKQTQASKNTLISSGLKLGSQGEQVKILQSALATDKSLYPSGIISGYYGQLTKEAVINFQEKYNLPQTGKIDQQTADKFNEVYGDKTADYYLSTVKNSSANTFTNTSNTINNNQNYIDPDPLINCSVHANCGGGTRLLKKSICDQSTCCQIGDTWIFYESKTKCLEDQKSLTFKQNNNFLNNNQYPTYSLPKFSPPQYYPCTLYYPALKIFQTYTSLYKTKEECDRAQESLNQRLSSLQFSTPTPYVYVPIKTKSQCESEIIEKYRNIAIQVAGVSNYSVGCSFPCSYNGDGCGNASVCTQLWQKAVQEMSICSNYPN